MEIIDIVKSTLEQNGVFLSDEDYNEKLELDSLQFVAIIVDLERKFQIEIDDIHLSQVELQCFNDFVSLIETVLQNCDISEQNKKVETI